MKHGSMKFGIFFLLATATSLSTARAQSVAPTNPVAAAVAYARSLADQGAGTAARQMLDSLVTAQSAGTVELAEALFWRGALAENIASAERDWIRVLVETPLADRANDALLRLAELETTRGRHAQALQYAERALRDHATSVKRPYALLWATRSAIASGKTAEGCAYLTDLSSNMPPDAVELTAQANDLRNRCTAPASTNVATNTTTASNSAAAASAQSNQASTRTTTAGRFSVQLAAFNRMPDAQALVKRLAGLGIEARVDGTAAPFRVRTGYYATRELAAKALADLEKKGHKGFVAEITP